MSLIQSIKSMFSGRDAHPCGCGGHEGADKTPAVITRDMIVRDVTARYPQTVSVFGNHKVDFCCGGAHSIEQTARARGCADVDALVADLNRAIQ
jgi:hypothetical protein